MAANHVTLLKIESLVTQIMTVSVNAYVNYIILLTQLTVNAKVVPQDVLPVHFQLVP